MPETQNIDLAGEGDQSNELRHLLQGLLKDYAELHAVRAAEKAALAKSLLELSVL